MKRWLHETHGPFFELFRHFVRRFFDSEVITTPGHLTTVLIGTLPVAVQWFLLIAGPLRRKYVHLSQLPTPGLYRTALRADELWLITLMTAVIGLLTAIKWPALFPDARDYRALGALPLRPRQIFGAKFAALLLAAAGTLLAVNFVPCVIFPALTASHWAFRPGGSVGYVVSSLGASAFAFFGLVALQGALLNVLPVRAFARLTGYMQGGLVALMLTLFVLSFSIQPQITGLLTRPEWARWLPPVWFLGLCQWLAGDPDPAMHALAQSAWMGLAGAAVVTLASYFIAYHRYRRLVIEGSGKRARRSWLIQLCAGALSLDPRQQAVIAFTLETMTRSNQHRLLLMGYGGFGFALLLAGVVGMNLAAEPGRVVMADFLTGLIGMSSAAEPGRAVVADFVFYHMLALLFLLIGARQLFSYPTDLKANWIFQITEAEGREAWLRAVDRLMWVSGAMVMLAVPAPLELRLAGLRGAAEMVLLALIGWLAYEGSFSSWKKLPFTCSYLPGKTPLGLMLACFGLLGALALLHGILLALLFDPLWLVISLAVLAVADVRLYRARRDNWEHLRLQYEELPAPAVEGLNLLK